MTSGKVSGWSEGDEHCSRGKKATHHNRAHTHNCTLSMILTYLYCDAGSCKDELFGDSGRPLNQLHLHSLPQ